MAELLLLIVFFSLPAILVLIRNIFHDTYIWQIKEYRVDRIISYLKYHEATSYRSVFINYVQLILFSLSLVFIFFPTNYLLIIPVVTFGTYVFEALDRLQEIISGKFVRPKKSIRNLLITGFSFITLLLPLMLPIYATYRIYSKPEVIETTKNLETEIISFEDILIQTDNDTEIQRIPFAIAILMITNVLILAIDLASPLSVSFWAIATEPLAQYKRNKTIKKAKSKINSHKPFKVVAITGSFGKSTTKEIVYELIKDNFKTAKTDENLNSTVGIAESVIRNLERDTEVFIAEMGAYRRGEIYKSTKLLVPYISIVTGITPQHISLFGSMTNLLNAKYEIVENLNPQGLAIFNANNQYCLQMSAKTDKRKLMYYTIDEETEVIHSIKTESKFPDPAKGMLYAKQIEETKDGYKFTIRYKNSESTAKVKITGRHNISNILASIGVALELGMNIDEIVEKLNKIKIPQVHLSWKIGINKSDILDDSYNTNPEGFKVALNLLQKAKGKRFVITKGIIELGSLKKEIYDEISKEISTKSDMIITNDKDLIKQIKQKNDKFETLIFKDEKEIVRFLNKDVKEGDNILLEGRFSPQLIKLVTIN